MKAYNEKYLFGILTLAGFGETQVKGQKCQISLLKLYSAINALH